MKKAIMLLMLTAFGMNAAAKEKKEWVYSDGVLEKVFSIDVSSKTTELLRLYDDGTYEHLRYTKRSGDKEIVDRNLGDYRFKRGKIIFDQPERKEFNGKFHFGSFFFNGQFYQSLFDMKFRRGNTIYKKTDDQKFFKPFFICLNKDEIVANSEAADQIDLGRVTEYLIRGKSRQEDKLMSLIQFIVGSVEYDRTGSKTLKYANQQDNAKGILAGYNRLAVCSGYSTTVKSLCELAGLEAELVQGYTRQGFSDLTQLGGYHAWNIVTIDGEKRIYDVTWADKGESIDMTWIDVDPLIMIGSHFPDMAEDQLLSDPLTQAEFLNTPVMTPIVASANPLKINIPARQFCGNSFKLALPGKHTVKVTLVPHELTETVYTGEFNAGSGSFVPKQVGSGHFDGDSTYFIVPLDQPINPLQIEIDGELELVTVAFKGGQTDLMKYYISRADKRHSDAFVKAVIAAIRINDEASLKQLVGSTNSNFFDKKGKLKLDKKVILACLDWTGDVTSLIKTKHISSSTDEDGVQQDTETIEWHIDIPGKLKFELGFEGGEYSVKKVELL